MIRASRLPSRTTSILALVATVTVGLLTWPLVAGRGYPLGRDLVFTPDQPFTPEGLGISHALPRAVPLDAVVAVLDSLVRGEVLARAGVIGGLLLAAWSAARASRKLSLPARVLCVGFSVWNPYVVERLALGQWALLLGYAACWGCLAVALDEAERRSARRVGPWLALGGLTPTGGLLAAGSAIALFGRAKGRRTVLLFSVLAQLPWLLPGLLSGTRGVLSDPRGVMAFASRTERPGGVVWSLLGLGGIWDRSSAPLSRSGILGHLTSALVLCALLGAVALLWSGPRRRLAVALPVACTAVLGFVLAAVSSVGWGERLLVKLVNEVPGAGLLRDSQKWLAWFVVAAVLAVAWCVDVSLEWVGKHLPVLSMSAVSLCVVLPLVCLPDAHRVVWPTINPVSYPADFDAVAAMLDEPGGVVVTLPWRSYRRFTWGNAVTVYDPASRWFDTPVIGSDDLVVGGSSIAGEDPVSREVATALAGPEATWASRLLALGVTHVLVYLDDPEKVTRIPGATRVYNGASLALWTLGPARPGQVAEVGARWTTGARALALVDGVIGVILLGAPFKLRARRTRKVA